MCNAPVVFDWQLRTLAFRYVTCTDIDQKNSSNVTRDIYRHDSGILFVAPAIIFDTTVGSLLTFGLYRRSRSEGAQTPLTRLVIEDGLLYFAVMFASNVAWILVHVLERDNLVGHSIIWVAARCLISRGCSTVYRYPGLYTVRNVSCRFLW